MLSFCIPVMNRLDDIKTTLKTNLLDNLEDQHQIEFLIVCFDEGTETRDWVEANFEEYLQTGYLRFVHLPNYLKSWHFCKAKNVFQKYLKGKIYASLDGDNYTGKNGGRFIIDVFKQRDFNCLFHQFQGTWGDGTCGRISLPANVYQEIGYEGKMLPRQADEMGVILTAIVSFKLRYVYYQDGANIFEKSNYLKKFILENDFEVFGFGIDKEHYPFFEEVEASVNQHDENYASDSELMKFYTEFNSTYSHYKNSQVPQLTQGYLEKLKGIQHNAIKIIGANKLFDSYFDVAQSNIEEGDIYLVSCVKDEICLKEFYQHYKKLGVTHFFIIDDYSNIPIEEVLGAYSDVSVFRPLVGQFRTSKVMWMEVILNKFCQNKWVFTVDSDEYVDLSEVVLST